MIEAIEAATKPQRQERAEDDLANAKLRRKRLLKLNGCSNGKLYDDIKAELFTEPVRRSHKDVYWPGSDYLAIMRAEMAGYTPEQIKALVRKLHEARKQPVGV